MLDPRLNTRTSFKNKLDFKEYLKNLANEIRQEKAESGYTFIKHYLSYTFRHLHLAYCALYFRTPYERIERKVGSGNEPNMNFIESIIEQNLGTRYAETDVCNSEG